MKPTHIQFFKKDDGSLGAFFELDGKRVELKESKDVEKVIFRLVPDGADVTVWQPDLGKLYPIEGVEVEAIEKEVRCKFPCGVFTCDETGCRDKHYKDYAFILDEKKEEGWEKSWEIVNAQIPNGVNPHAYRLGWLDAKKKETNKEILIRLTEGKQSPWLKEAYIRSLEQKEDVFDTGARLPEQKAPSYSSPLLNNLIKSISPEEQKRIDDEMLKKVEENQDELYIEAWNIAMNPKLKNRQQVIDALKSKFTIKRK